MINLKKHKYSGLILLLSLSFSNAFSQLNPSKSIKNINASGDAVYLNLQTGTISTAADTAKNEWDVALQHTTLILQSGAEAQVVANTAFDQIAVAPLHGYQHGKAGIPSGSGNGWYNYNMDNHVISPIPGRVIIIHTNADKYVKLAIDSYYKDGPDGQSGYYTLHYTFIEPAK